jgi:hypothetical protein
MSAPSMIMARNDREVIGSPWTTTAARTLSMCGVWYRAGAELKPGQQGITTNVANLPALAAGLKPALDRAREMRLVD